MKIGMFDSGVGGLTLLHKAIQMMPEEAYFYYADTDHVPYGKKPVEDVISYSDDAVSFLQGMGCEAIVIACNTATSVAAEYLRHKYDIPIIGIEPAVKPAVENNNGGRILVIATPLTVKERKLIELVGRVDEEHKVDMLALPELVSFAERGEFDSGPVSEYLKTSLDSFFEQNKQSGREGISPEKYDVLVFGCTHFNHFEATLRRYFGNSISMIDGAEGTIKNLKNIMKERGSVSEGALSVDFFESGRPVTDKSRLDFYKVLLSHLD
ncbi:MAG: glutamate racemase [Lachnospiraceae bacterium]|nr:glutamate racemase [Lachnospiraceae bacterium]